MYADDIALVIGDTDLDSAIMKLNVELENLNRWLCYNYKHWKDEVHDHAQGKWQKDGFFKERLN